MMITKIIRNKESKDETDNLIALNSKVITGDYPALDILFHTPLV